MVLTIVLIITFIIRKIVGLFKKPSDEIINMDIYLTPPQIIRKHGYPAESHTIISPDGYFLELHRIPRGKAHVKDGIRTPILLQHGTFSSSVSWIMNGPEKSLGYRLADEGYDVWMMNTRGNPYSTGHIKYTTSQKEYWDFSYHESGIYDLPTVIDYVLEITKHKQLVHIGHSLGATMFYIMASTLAEYNEKIKFHIAVAPVGNLTQQKSVLFTSLTRIEKILKFLNPRGILLKDDYETKFLRMVYHIQKFFKVHLYEHLVITSFCGSNLDQFNPDVMPIFAVNHPVGTSVKTLLHSIQTYKTGRFQLYDYGELENQKKYQTSIPPEYDFSRIRVPMRFYYGEGDTITTPQNVILLYQKLPRPLGLVRINHDKYSHLHFLMAKDLNRLFLDDVIKFIKDCTDYDRGTNFIRNTVQDAVQEQAQIRAMIHNPST